MNDRTTGKVLTPSFQTRLSNFRPTYMMFMRSSLQKNAADFQEEKVNGLTDNMTSLFVIAAITGSAILSLPMALKNTGWYGVFMIIICGVNSLYAGMILGWCWNMMQESWPEYKEPSDIPYPEMGRKAVGNWMKYTVMVCLVVSQVGAGIVWLILISKHIEGASSGELKFCYVMILAFFLIIPLTWFRTPADFWFMAIADVFCSILFTFLLHIAFFIDKEKVGTVSYPNPTFSSFTVSFGSLMFSYAGGGVYPTIQNDMLFMKRFSQSVFTGFLVIFIIYLPFAILGYAAYGHTTGIDVTEMLKKNPDLIGLANFLQFLSLTQLTTTLIIYLNPTFKLLEHLLDCPKHFGSRRCMIRTSVMFFVFIIAFGLPNFTEVAVALSSVTIGLLTSIFPTIFYIRLVHKRAKKNKEVKITLKNGIFLVGITTLGTLGILASIFTAQNRLSNKTYITSCFSHAASINGTNLNLGDYDLTFEDESLMYMSEEYDFESFNVSFS